MTDDNGAATPLLALDGLTTRLRMGGGMTAVVRRLSLTLRQGEILGLVGESGSGKSVTLRSIMQLLPRGVDYSGSVRWRGEELIGAGEPRLRHLRGREMAMIFQEPMTALNPVLTVGRQIDESLRAHRQMNKRQRRDETIALLERVGIPAAAGRLNDYPHQFSGGMRQRVMIATALAAGPRLLLADEPTTALDVTIQQQILTLLLRLRDESGMSMIFVTHDLAVVAQLCDRVAVMYAGELVESGPVRQLLRHPQHPYTRSLLAAIPQTGRNREPLAAVEGTPPALNAMPSGCPFHPRCGFRSERCLREEPVLRARIPGTLVACHHADELRSAS
ncbi:ABC transporter ATP-binding protein [Martelella alba]|nr:ABC transporter ATP-binding protein [Martelella alba]